MSKYKVPGAYIRRGDYTEGFFCVTSLGGGGLSLEGFIFGILRYSISKSQNFTDVYKGGGGGRGHKLSPHHASVCKFSQLCMAISSLA